MIRLPSESFRTQLLFTKTTFNDMFKIYDAEIIRLNTSAKIYLTTSEVAQILNMSAQTICTYIDEGKIPGFRLGKGPRKVLVKDLLSFIKTKGIPDYLINQDKLKEHIDENESEVGSV